MELAASLTSVTQGVLLLWMLDALNLLRLQNKQHLVQNLYVHLPQKECIRPMLAQNPAASSFKGIRPLLCIC